MGEPRKLTEDQLIKRLQYLADCWPDEYWLFAANGLIHLMKKNENGTRAYADGGGVDQDYVVTTFSGIACDGGDW